jgi:hypothetical protein
MKGKPFNKFRIMMKSILVCAALLVTTFFATAQTWHFGPKVDINYSAIKGNGIRNKYSPGFQIGGFAEYNINKHLAIQPELLYTWSPYKKSGDFLTYYNNYGRSAAGNNINLAYISVPVLLRYNFNKIFSVLAGPQYSYLLYDDEDLLKDEKQAFKNYELSANLGVQVNLQNVGFYARFNKGLSNINDVDERYTWKSNHVQVGMAVRIM